VPVALITARADHVSSDVSTSSRGPGRTAETVTGRRTSKPNSRSYAAKYAGTAVAARSSSDGGANFMPGRSKMPCTVAMRSVGHRCCHAPPGTGFASSTAKSMPARRRKYALDNPA
jgi:hypothetical protein